jgi:peptidoglycan/LPS O-acetylase OafA/YrhL
MRDYRLFMPSISLDSGSVPIRTKARNGVTYPELDGLRGLAFLMVFLQHYLFLPWAIMGVNVFFVLSGFLITGILIETRHQPHRARNFYMRRTLRISPLYYAVCLLALASYPVFRWQWSWAWLAWPLYVANFLLFVDPSAAIANSTLYIAGIGRMHTLFPVSVSLNFGHFWSLCVEEQFYLFWPWVVFFIRKGRTLLSVCVITVVTVPVLRLLAQRDAPSWMLTHGLLFRGTPFQLDALIWGALIAVLWKSGRWSERMLIVGRYFAAACLLLSVVYLAVTVHPFRSEDWRHTYVYPSWTGTWGLSFVDIFTVSTILCCLKPHALLVATLGAAPLRWIGRISYGAYVFHDIFHDILLQIVWHLSGRWRGLAPFDEYLAALLGFLLTLILATLSFRYLETPFLKLKDRYSNKA